MAPLASPALGRTYVSAFRTYLTGGIDALRAVHFYQLTSDLDIHRT